jgi:hypothetical protein
MAKKIQLVVAIVFGIVLLHLGLSHLSEPDAPFGLGVVSPQDGNPSHINQHEPGLQQNDRNELEMPLRKQPEEESKPRSNIAKITMLYGDTPNPAYERALQSHALHADMHGYPLYVLRQKMLGRLWTKPAWILATVLAELAKPPPERLQWLFWFDADTFLLNPKIPLDLYLPPSDVHGVHFLCGNDHNGLNDGAFLLRVNDYSVHMLAASLSVETFRPNVDLRYSEQSAIENVVHEGGVYRPWDGTTYLQGYAEIPQRWLNAYMGSRNDSGAPISGKKAHANGVKPGGESFYPCFRLPG